MNEYSVSCLLFSIQDESKWTRNHNLTLLGSRLNWSAKLNEHYRVRALTFNYSKSNGSVSFKLIFDTSKYQSL